jgi:O-antigen/teichoic acid export membrane protein
MENNSNYSLKSKFISASKWSTSTELVSKAVAPIAYIVLTRLLTPEDFGVVAVATILISFSQVFWDAGLSKALIQRQNDIENSSDIVFWTNLLLAVIIYALLFFLAGPVSLAFDEPKAKYVIQIQGILIVLMAFSSVHTALFQRNLNFKPLFYLRLFTTAIPTFASIPLAFIGLGYWALVTGTLIGGILQIIVLLKMSTWRPRFSYDRKLALRLFSFGLWVTGESFLTSAFRWLDTTIVGLYLGIHALGLYQTGSSLIIMIFGLLLSPLLPVLFSAFSKMQDNKERFLNAYLRSNKIIIMIALPVGCGAFVLQDSIAGAIFNEDWTGIAPVIGWLGLANGVAWIMAANNEAYRSIGQPDINTKIMAVAMLLFLPAELVAVQFGFKTFLIVRFFLSCAAVLIHLYAASRYLNIKWTTIFGQAKWILIASFGMGLILHNINSFLNIEPALIMQLIVQIGIGIGLYLTLMYKEWPFMRQLINSVILKEGPDK